VCTINGDNARRGEIDPPDRIELGGASDIAPRALPGMRTPHAGAEPNIPRAREAGRVVTGRENLGDSAPRAGHRNFTASDALATPRRVALATFIVYLALALTKLAVRSLRRVVFSHAASAFAIGGDAPALTIPRKMGSRSTAVTMANSAIDSPSIHVTNRPVEFGIGPRSSFLPTTTES